MIHLPAMTAASPSRNESSSRRLAGPPWGPFSAAPCAMSWKWTVCSSMVATSEAQIWLGIDQLQCVQPVQMMYIMIYLYLYRIILYIHIR